MNLKWLGFEHEEGKTGVHCLGMGNSVHDASVGASAPLQPLSMAFQDLELRGHMEARGLFVRGQVSQVCRTGRDNIFSLGKLERSNE